MTLRHTDDRCLIPHTRDPERARRAEDGLYACHGCLQQLEANLGNLPARWHALEAALRPSSSGHQRVSGTPGTPDAIVFAVADHRTHIRAVLASWARIVTEDRGVIGPATPNVDHTAPFLTTHARWAAGHRWIAEMAVEVRGLAGRAHALLNPRGGRRVEIGPCLEDDCGGTLWATVRAEDDDRQSVIYCSACDMERPSHEWMRFAREYQRERMTA